jgi:hypothetical protein
LPSADARLPMRLQQSAGGGWRSRGSSTPLVCAAPIRARRWDWPSGAAGSGGQQGGGREGSGRRAVRRHRLPVADSVGCACPGLGGLAARAFQRAAALGAGRASAGAVGAAGDAGLPFPPAVAAPPPNVPMRTRPERVRIELAVAGRVQLGGQVGAQYGERPLARNRPPRAAPGTTLTVLRGYPPLVPAGAAPPPDRLHGPARNRGGVEVAVAGRVELGDEVGAQDRERPLARDRRRNAWPARSPSSSRCSSASRPGAAFVSADDRTERPLSLTSRSPARAGAVRPPGC